MPLHWPSHKYLGPGTSDFTATPVDRDDEIAREHDLDYNFALTGNEIHEADKHAISDFWSDFTHSGNFHSLVGTVGLGLKYGTESLLHTTLYPRMNPSSINKAVYSLRQRYLSRYAREHNISYQEAQRNQREILNNSTDYQSELSELKRTFNSTNSFESATDRLNRQRGLGRPLASSTQHEADQHEPQQGPSNQPDIHNEETVNPEDYFQDMTLFDNVNTQAMDVVDSANNQQRNGGGGQAIGGPSVMGQSPEIQILKNPSIAPQSFSIRHSHLFQSWGFKYNVNELQTAGGRSYLLHVPLAVLPVDFLPFYLTPAEFENLPHSCFIEEVFVKVTPKGIRCSFDTGSTLSSTANNQQTIFGITGVGLNHKYLIRHRHVKNNATDPMSPTYEEINKDHVDLMVTRMWGTKSSSTDFSKQFPTSLWTVRSLPFYAGFFLPHHSATTNTSFHLDTGHIDLTSHTNVFNILDHKDIPCINYSYKPQFAPCKVKKNIVGTDGVIKPAHEWLGNYQSQYDIRVKVDGGKLSESHANGAPVSWESDNDYAVPIEQGHYKTMPQRPFHTITQPQVHLGILPVQSNAPSDVDATFVNASAIYYVETEIKFRTDINSLFNRADVVSHMSSVYDRSYNIANMYNIEHFGGLISVKQ